MEPVTILDLDDHLPLTCTRSGTCCHGKHVWLNPWELACLARARGIEPAEARRSFTVDGGTRLRFDGPPGWKNSPACSQYDPAVGCTIHEQRPLACRLYPLGRRRQGEAVGYIHDGSEFPCLAGCPAVTGLPHLTVEAYLAGQEVAVAESVADAYLEICQDLAEGAFVLVFDSGLAMSGTTGVLSRWRLIVDSDARTRIADVAPSWLDALQIPRLDPRDGRAFAAAHRSLLQTEAQAAFASLTDAGTIADASLTMLALALHLAQSLGGDPVEFGRHWCDRAEAEGLS
ncbi:MAG: YkgJ family cysteine cluster protein [Planctomycetes bacterium]|nr:YkgJ family cysteine cluster protein [Planctomycetota bacterium]